MGRDQIAFLKKLADGSTLFLVEIRTGNKQVAALSMRKYPPAMNADSILSTLDPNARSNREAGLKIVDVRKASRRSRSVRRAVPRAVS